MECAAVLHCSLTWDGETTLAYIVCMCWKIYNSATSHISLLICHSFLSPVPAQIVIKPADKRLYQNSTVLLTCVAYGFPLPTLTWSKARNSVTNGTVRNDIVVKGGVTFVRSVLQLCGTTVADSGQYTCTADNEITIANANFRLTVEGIERHESKRKGLQSCYHVYVSFYSSLAS